MAKIWWGVKLGTNCSVDEVSEIISTMWLEVLVRKFKVSVGAENFKYFYVMFLEIGNKDVSMPCLRSDVFFYNFFYLLVCPCIVGISH